METRDFIVAYPIVAIALAFGGLFLAMNGRTRTGAAAIILAVVAMVAGAYLISTDDTPTWDERMGVKYDVNIDDYPARDKDRPGAWKIDGEWRTCYSPDFYDVEDDETLLCQPVTPEMEFEELAK